MAPPTAGFDPESVQAATDLPHDYSFFSYKVEASSRRVDLMNKGEVDDADARQFRLRGWVWL